MNLRLPIQERFKPRSRPVPDWQEDLRHRVAQWLDGPLDGSGLIVAVTHASVILAAIVHTIEAGPRSFWRIDVAPLSVARLSGDRGCWTLSSVGPMRAGADPE